MPADEGQRDGTLLTHGGDRRSTTVQTFEFEKSTMEQAGINKRRLNEWHKRGRGAAWITLTLMRALPVSLCRVPVLEEFGRR